MCLPVHSEGRLVHESRDVVFPLKLDLPCLQVLGCEVWLHVSDLDVGVLRIQARHVHLKQENVYYNPSETKPPLYIRPLQDCPPNTFAMKIPLLKSGRPLYFKNYTCSSLHK